MKKNLFQNLILVAIFSIIGSQIVFAQPPPPGLPGDVVQAPIDGGLSILALGGAAYALKRLKGNKSEK